MAQQKLARGRPEEIGRDDGFGGRVLVTLTARKKMLTSLFIGGIILALLAWRILFPWLGTKESELYGLISKIENAQPISNKAQLPNLPCDNAYKVGADSCWSKMVKAGNITIGEVDFRPQTNGSILVLKDIGPKCFEQSLTFKRYPGGVIESSCSHKYCSYYKVKRSWGRISFSLPTDSNRDLCISGIVLESGTRD